jgi:hypothetical protein
MSLRTGRLAIKHSLLSLESGIIGKMEYRDHIKCGSPITRKAIDLILERSMCHGSESK